MKKVLFFLSSGCGGAERTTITYAKMLDRKSFDVHFVIVGRDTGVIREFIPRNYPVSLIKVRNIYDFSTFRIYLFIRKQRPQIVFSSLMYLNPRVIFAANRVGGCKTIIRFNCAVNRLKGFVKIMTKMTYHRADVIIAQTEKMQLDLENTFKIPNGKVITLHNPIDKSTIIERLKNVESPYPDKRKQVYVWVGRFNEIKRVDILIKAFAKVHGVCDQSELYLVGKINKSNDIYNKVIALVQNLGIQNDVFFTDFQTNPYKWIKYADCLVLTSRSEASPNVVFESLYLGTPVVVSDCTPDLEEIVTKENGCIVPVGDVDKTAEAMMRAISLTFAILDRETANEETVNQLFI